MTILDVDGARLEAAWVGPPRDDGPVLVFLHEGLGSIAQVEAIERGLGGPCERELVPGAGHAPHRSDPARVHARIVRFLQIA